jgi:hydrophobic/amphiphilic exporter-1 (mainly G- bacteria), HAE1 family
MSNFFIKRPIVAIVISLLIIIVGVVTVSKLPIEQYPQLAPPTIRVEATFQGASAEVVEQSVATPIEQQVNGVDNMIYMKSLNTSDGRMMLDVSFDVGMDLDIANVLVQNRVSQAQSRLPQEVIQQGVTVKKINPSILMMVSLYSPKGTYDDKFLNNYAMINLRDAILRVKGVAQVDLWGGAEYGMRVWIDPDKLAKLGLTPADVYSAIKEQNIQAPAGQVGAAPSPPGQEFTYTVRAPGRFSTPEEFEKIIIRSSATGGQVTIADVGRVELGSENYKAFGRLNGAPSSILAVFLLPGANQIQAAEGIYKNLDEQKKFFPQDVDYTIVYDTTPAVVASIEEITKTLEEAIILVLLVVFIFLQNWRATLIPMLTVPVSLLGTFIFFPFIGFTVNTLSMFGLVLAIGIVVDDAIVVVEAVMHHIEHGLSPKDATIKAMAEVGGAVVGIAMILSAVFIPVAFLGGLTGMMYKQFALTIAISVLISAFNALSLSPALAAMFLKPAPPQGAKKNLLAKFFGLFNKGFDKTTNGYVSVTGRLARKAAFSVVFVLGVIAVSWLLGKTVPGGFVPDEDQGILLVNIKLPNASSLQRTDEVCRRIEEVVKNTPGVDAYNTIGGLAMLNNTFTSNVGTLAIRLKPWAERKDPAVQLKGITAHLQREFKNIPGAIIFPFAPPTIPGFGAAGGFTFMLQDRSGTFSVEQLGENTNKFFAAAAERPELANLFTSFDAGVPQIKLELDREKARTLGVPINDVFSALQTALGGAYVNDFNRFGRLYRVYLQAESWSRQKAEDIGRFYVRSKTTNTMVPLSTLVKIESVSGTELTARFNLFRSVEISGGAGPGYSSKQAMKALEEISDQVLPPEMSYAYSGFSYQEKIAPPAGPTFIMAIIFVFLLLAAMYDSWKLPWSVLLGSPLVIMGALFGVWLAGYDNNVFVQVGLVMLIGLAAKNAILIVEFAKAQHETGKEYFDAAIEAARLRFRPILMTAFAFILGVIPLMRATGSGAGSRTVMGTAVFWGMLIATALGVFFIPSFYVFIEKFGFKKKPKEEKTPASEPMKGEHHS